MTNKKEVKSERVLSIDALRGFDMLWLTGGAGVLTSLFATFNIPGLDFLRTQFEHAKWEGMTFEDIIMPLFMYITGCSMVFSFPKRLEREGKKKVYTHVIFRVSLLWLFGMVYQGRLLNLNWAEVYLYNNTLQAIAMGYLGAALILLVKDLRLQISLTVLCLIIYSVILNFTGGDMSLEGNMASKIDNFVLSTHRHGTEYTWVLSSFNFIVTVMLGVFSGALLKNSKQSKKQRVKYLFAYGVLVLLAGYGLSFYEPCIKKIWTSSFTLISGAWCILLLSLFFYVLDVLELRKGAVFFTVIGSNALFAYLVFGYNRFFNSEIFVKQFVYGTEQYFSMFNSIAYSAFTACLGLILTWLVLFYMQKNKIFLKV
ncbi:hypothetical protein PQO03_08630 [Lentisphaera profundi]|uniref:DUF5009 domain-containing protein n=1 Tax=Lentisphaera profundi TaxID=1658616 RepID=A0ABY7VPY4_9BACT|nr:hypothetical protein [Lentisphaera profundi]WDE95779.1 hypothetical protein PQO03_08630 [Lentisphaera profundi]